MFREKVSEIPNCPRNDVSSPGSIVFQGEGWSFVLQPPRSISGDLWRPSFAGFVCKAEVFFLVFFSSPPC